MIASYMDKIKNEDERIQALKALFQVFSSMADVVSRIAVGTVNSRRNLHIKEMSFKNKSTENKLKNQSTLGPNLFAGKFFELLHDSADNIRDAKETQHLRKYSTKNMDNKKPDLKRKKDFDQNQTEKNDTGFKKPRLTSPQYHHRKNKKQTTENSHQKSDSDSFQKKGPGQLGFRPQK